MMNENYGEIKEEMTKENYGEIKEKQVMKIIDYPFKFIPIIHISISGNYKINHIPISYFIPITNPIMIIIPIPIIIRCCELFFIQNTGANSGHQTKRFIFFLLESTNCRKRSESINNII